MNDAVKGLVKALTLISNYDEVFKREGYLRGLSR